MSDHDDNSPSARLAVQRLTKPGVLDRSVVQRKHAQLQQPIGTHELTDQLLRRAAPAGESREGSFVWRRSAVRTDASAEVLPVAAGFAATSPPTVTTASSSALLVQRAALPTSDSAPLSVSLTERLLSRAHSPGMLAAAPAIAHTAAAGSLSGAPAFAADLQSRYVGPSGGTTDAPMPVKSAPASVIRRQVDSTAQPSERGRSDAASVLAPSPVSSGGPAPPVLARKAMSPLPTADVSASAASLPGSTTAPVLVARGVDTQSGFPTMSAARPMASSGSAGASAPLVLRRMLAAPTPSSMPMTTTMSPMGAESPGAAPAVATMMQPAAAPAMKVGAHTGADIDRITEEVSRRLMRRLEIERERKGIRSWR